MLTLQQIADAYNQIDVDRCTVDPEYAAKMEAEIRGMVETWWPSFNPDSPEWQAAAEKMWAPYD